MRTFDFVESTSARQIKRKTCFPFDLCSLNRTFASMKYEDLWQQLSSIYETGEAKAIVRYVLEIRYGLSMTDIMCGAVEQLPEEELGGLVERLLQGEPVQYVTGIAEFGGRHFHVEPGVLIPRPETYELCEIVRSKKQEARSKRQEVRNPKILDIGTGSGCIACTLAAEIPNSEVTAWDISEKALHIAEENAKRTGVHMSFEQRDILLPPSSFLLPPSSRWDTIVSNPPYICNKERVNMERNVLEYEPSLALFVPDEDPLLFYRAISRFAKTALKDGGNLYFEINPLYAEPLKQLMEEEGFADIMLYHDSFGKQRFAHGRIYHRQP